MTWWDYRLHALVATVRTSEPHNTIARQVFDTDSIIASLPLNDPYLCSIIWSLSPEKAQYAYSIEPKEFNQVLCVAFDNRLGLCELGGKRQVFPLIGRYAHHFTGHRLALIGDAAHTIHPLAGQGINLGFMDVAELIKELRRLHREGKDIGQRAYLRRYERSRKRSAAIMLAVTHGLHELFTGNNQIKKLLRDIGMNFIDKSPSIKLQLMRLAMGLNNLPKKTR